MSKTVRQLSAIAERAVDRAAVVLRTASWLEHPRTKLKRWPMTEMLTMAAGEFGDPVTELILVIAGDHPIHRTHHIRRLLRSPGGDVAPDATSPIALLDGT